MRISPLWNPELRYIRTRQQVCCPSGGAMSAQRGWHDLGRWTLGVRLLPWCASAVVAATLAGCTGGSSVNIANSQTIDAATVDYPIFYVKHTVPTNQNGTLQQDDLRIIRDLVPSADLYERTSAS